VKAQLQYSKELCQGRRGQNKEVWEVWEAIRDIVREEVREEVCCVMGYMHANL